MKKLSVVFLVSLLFVTSLFVFNNKALAYTDEETIENSSVEPSVDIELDSELNYDTTIQESKYIEEITTYASCNYDSLDATTNSGSKIRLFGK